MALCKGEITQPCIETHETENDAQWTIYKMGENGNIIIELTGDTSVSEENTDGKIPDAETRIQEQWLKFIDSLPESEPRYGVFSYKRVDRDVSGKETSNHEMKVVIWDPKKELTDRDKDNWSNQVSAVASTKISKGKSV